MTYYIDLPDAGPVQGIWHYRPRPDDWPNYLCDDAKESMHTTDLTSVRRFFREHCRWRWRAVRGITAIMVLKGQTWRPHPPTLWPIARR
jgi:hypothetical protein